MRANQACSSGPLAESAKNGSPIETANSAISHSSAKSTGGRPHPAAMASGSENVATAIRARCATSEPRPGMWRVIRCA